MIRLLWALTILTCYFARSYMPTNILLDLICSRRGLKWGLPAMLLAAPQLLAASICTNLIAEGGPGWISILVILFITWNALKHLIMNPLSLTLLIRARVQEAAARRRGCDKRGDGVGHLRGSKRRLMTAAAYYRCA